MFDTQLFQFKWESEKTVSQNFQEWYILNSEERSAYHEEILPRDEAIEIFEKMYNVSVDNS